MEIKRWYFIKAQKAWAEHNNMVITLAKVKSPCCKDAVLAGKCNYFYICNTILTYHKPANKTQKDRASRIRHLQR